MWRLDSATYWKSGTAMFFKGSEYVRYDLENDRAHLGYPRPINGNWPGLPWRSGIDAVFNNGKGKLFFLRGSQYVQYDIDKDRADSGYPKPIADKWPGLPWRSGIDAVLTGWSSHHTFSGSGRRPSKKSLIIDKAYFFKGKHYVRYDLLRGKVDSSLPWTIRVNWPGLGFSSGIDAAFSDGGGKYYFFRGNQYVRYDIGDDRADDGYPKKALGDWPGLWDIEQPAAP